MMTSRIFVATEEQLAKVVESAIARALKESRRADDDILCVGEAAKLLGVRPETLRKKAGKGEVAGAFKPGGGRKWFFKRRDLLDHVHPSA